MENSLTFRNILLYYYRYKGTTYFTAGVSGVVIVISLLLILLVIIPQIQHVLSVRREVETVEENIAVMEANRDYLNSINSNQEMAQTEIVLATLPVTKDYAGIYTAIVSSARESGVGLSNFQYQVGALDEAADGNTISELKVSLSLSGTPQAMQNFLSTLSESVPLSEARVITGDDGLANAEAVFYYGGELIIQIDPKVPLKPLSPEKIKLLSTLSERVPQQVESELVSSSATDSGSFSQSPF